MPRGGARPGAGRPRKSAATRWVSGNAGKRHLAAVPAAVPSPAGEPSRTPPTVEPMVCPQGDLPTDTQQAFWARWAPLAQEVGTLTAATLPGFVTLCQVAARLAEVSEDIDANGLTATVDGHLKAHPLLPTYRGLVQRQEMLLQRYQLAAMAKAAMTAPGAPMGGAPPAEDDDAAIVRALTLIK